MCCHRARQHVTEGYFSFAGLIHGLINHIGTKANCRHQKILTFKGTLRPVYIWVYSLEKQSVMLVFSPQLCKLLPLSPSLWFNLPPSPVWKSILYTRIQMCKSGGGGYGVLSLRQINTRRKVQVTFFRCRHCALPFISLIFLRLIIGQVLHIYEYCPTIWNGNQE